MRRAFIGVILAAASGCAVGEVGGTGAPTESGSISGTGNGSNSSRAQAGNGLTGSSAGGSSGPGMRGATSGGGASSNSGSSGAGADAGAVSIAQSGIDGGPPGLPCDVQQLLAARCQSCHSSPPLPPAPMALLTQANLTAPALADVTKTYAEMSVSRMQNTMIPMPPLPATPATSAEVATLQKWINAGYPSGSCGGGGIAPPVLDGGAAEASASAYTTPTVCTSMVTWTRGNGQTMRPGEACISCHSRGDGPAFAIAGTIYPSAHEPDDCNGASATTNGATVVITDKSGTARTLTPDAVGNFSYSGTLATPFQAKVVQAGKERIMVTPQTSGDCNGCHTQTGANGAPGRIMLP